MAKTNEPAFAQFFDDVGNGSGSTDGALDFSVTPKTFLVKPPAGTIYQLGKLFVIIRDNAIVNERYGNIVGGVTNGYTLNFQSDDPVLDIPLFGGLVVRTNLDLAESTFEMVIFDNGAGDATLTASQATIAAGDIMVSLNGDKGERLAITLNDDFSSLESHRFKAEGYIDI